MVMNIGGLMCLAVVNEFNFSSGGLIKFPHLKELSDYKGA